MSDYSKPTANNQAYTARVFISILAPVATAVLAGFIVSNISDDAQISEQAVSAILLTAAALVSWLLGLHWYGLSGMGVRGGRPLTAGIGFASLLWIIFLILRFVFVNITPSALEERPPDAARTYIYILLFESLAAQIWAYGLVFRTVSDWRGPITAAIVSGLLFGLTGTLLFQEAFVNTVSSTIYFIVWGILYGIIRLRTGSFLGTALVQSVQSFTTWVVLAPGPDPITGQLNNLYLSATIAYMIIAWRLWPKDESDYRI